MYSTLLGRTKLLIETNTSINEISEGFKLQKDILFKHSFGEIRIIKTARVNLMR